MTKHANAFVHWVHDTTLAGGTRIFRLEHPAAAVRYAVADESGDNPEQTDDGVLWLDFSVPISVGTNVFEGREYICIPLINDAGERSRTITTMQGALYLSARFDWKIRNDENSREYEVVDIIEKAA
jgi:hypothetical protein